MKLSKRLKRTLSVVFLLLAFVVAQVPAMAMTSDNKTPVTKQVSKTTEVAIRAERAFNVEGKIMGQLVIERLDANRSPIVLPDAPARSIDHVPLY